MYTVAVSCWVVGNETCAAPAAAHVFGQCRACSCSHHIISGQPFVPSRLSHLAVHGTIDRTIRRFWVDELWWTMMNSFPHWLYLACTKFDRSNQARSESILGSHRTTTWRTCSCCSTCLNTCERNQKWHSFCWRIHTLIPFAICFLWVSLRTVLICLKPVALNRTAIWMKDQTTVPICTNHHIGGTSLWPLLTQGSSFPLRSSCT